ncbi:poly-gamma-glutamate synthesis protein (capsule biosynthesis protein) [Butyrivibrio fibrisolvens DSM 3071]|uniref:Poly-gamma-glutamate synthesis protein (Capsule biosynthesis protein) n=2 Tax=Butyrivibrio fibrisolvens TaxID=831 RepID=A0A1M5SYE0_BUTFI|nr:poly-gamma-glutamate synthesis protein (capsule biosynthesis protein) [Butyrivibrio fibrisolvens DSM 3071]
MKKINLLQLLQKRVIASLFSISLIITACGSSTGDTNSVTMTTESVVDEKDLVNTSNEPDSGNNSSTEGASNELTDEDIDPNALANTEESIDNSFSYTLCFAGDINFDDTWSNMVYYHNHGDDIYNCIDEDFIIEMNAADIMWINNEFTYSTGGAPMAGKAYTFRANPQNVYILNQLGVDIVGLANNHVFDYGEEAFLDTLATLEADGIPYVGAGRNIEEASSPVYMQLGDLTIAYVAASRAEKNKMTPEATQTSPGILRCYDTEKFVAEIKEASENADFVIALPHWGTEYSTKLESAQTSTAREYIDAGADVIIGAHSHCLQGMEYYNGSLIAYSLGNYWFNEKTLDTMLLEVEISGTGSTIESVEVQMIPGTQSGWVTTAADTPEEKERIYSYMESISIDVEVDDNGYIHPAS